MRRAAAVPSPMQTALGLAVMVAFSGPATASTISNGTGLAAANTVLSFDEIPLAQNELVTTQYAGFGVTFTNLAYNPSCCDFDFPGVSGNRIGDLAAPSVLIGQPVLIEFDELQTEVAFGIGSNPGVMTFTALLGGVPVESFTFDALPGTHPGFPTRR